MMLLFEWGLWVVGLLLMPLLVFLSYIFLWWSRISPGLNGGKSLSFIACCQIFLCRYLLCRSDSSFRASPLADEVLADEDLANEVLVDKILVGKVLRAGLDERKAKRSLLGIYLGLLLFFLLLIGSSLIVGFKFLWIDVLFLLFVLPLIAFDARFCLLPDIFTLPLLWLGIFFALVGLLPQSLASSVLGVMGGYLFMSIFYYVGRYYYRQEVLGRGDLKFVAAISAWLGISNLTLFIFLSAVMGLIFYMLQPLILRGDNSRRFTRYFDNNNMINIESSFERSRKASPFLSTGFLTLKTFDKMIPFGPFLGLSGIILYFITRSMGG